MLRHLAQRLASLQVRSLSTSASRLEEASASGTKEFLEQWNKKAAIGMDPPLLPSSFLKASGLGESKAHGDLFPVNFYMPHAVICDMKEKDSVILPGIDGYFGLKANHVPLISQLKPGIIELTNGAETEKYFVSGGFAFVHPNGVTDICVLEAATLDQVDGAAVKTALAVANTAQGQGDEQEQAGARAAVELYAALDAALDNKA